MVGEGVMVVIMTVVVEAMAGVEETVVTKTMVGWWLGNNGCRGGSDDNNGDIHNGDSGGGYSGGEGDNGNDGDHSRGSYDDDGWW